MNGEIPEEEFDDMMRLAWQVPGLVRGDEARFLYRLARRKGNFVEIGCWLGRTSIIMALGAKVWGANLTTIDPFIMPSQFEQATPEKWRENLSKAGISPLPRLLVMASDEAAKLYGEPISLLFIDGGHNEEQVLSDLNNWAGRVQIGDFVALHDMFTPGVNGVLKAVAAWWRSDTWEYWGQAHTLIAFRRIG